MTTQPHLDPNGRKEFVLIFDVTNGNPNGDPDAGNMPRIDPETMQGIVTDVALKRKLRNYVDALRGNDGRFKIYVQQGVTLNGQHERAYTALGKKTTKPTADTVNEARQWMCDNFFDVRTFGAVMSTKVNAGQVRGPVQLTFARSVDPIMGLSATITRLAVTDAKDLKEDTAKGEEEARVGGTMGRKTFTPYGLYVAHGFYVPAFAKQTGFSEEDLELLWKALVGMWDLDRSASRGLTACRGLYVFSHDSELGNAPAHKLLDRVKVERKEGVEAPRNFSDYTVTVDTEKLPAGVHFTDLSE